MQAGVHFGHKTQRWNPKMKQFIYGQKNGTHILDLPQTKKQLQAACKIIEKIIKNRQRILFVGTKKQAKSIVKLCATECREFFITDRWLGGLLTNSATIRKSIKKLQEKEEILNSGAEHLTKKEKTLLTKSVKKTNEAFSGVKSMRHLPGLLIIVDPEKEHIAVSEARKLHIPVMAIVDTNCNPDVIDYIIAGNDDSLKSNSILLHVITRQIIKTKQELGLIQSAEIFQEEKDEEKSCAKEEPMNQQK